MGRVKVLYIIDSLEGYGAEKSIVNIALNMKLVVPVFIQLYKGSKLKSSLTKKGIAVYSLDLNSNYGFNKAVKTIIPIIDKEQPDIIHSTLFRADMVARKLKNVFPNIILVGSFVSNSYGISRYRKLNSLSKLKLFTTQCRDKLSARKVDFFICNSNAIKSTNLKALAIPENKVKVIYRGRNFEDYKATREEINEVRTNLNLNNKTIFLNVGRLNRGKGQIELVEAFKKISDKKSDVILLIAGEGSLRSEIEELITSLQLQNKVFLLGYREDVGVLLNLADYFVFPTFFEGLPGALIEAIISKTPAIVSDIAENRECFGNDEALFFLPGNVSDLQAKMVEALNITDWAPKTKRSYEYAFQKFEIKKVSEEYEKFYGEIGSRKTPQAEGKMTGS